MENNNSIDNIARSDDNSTINASSKENYHSNNSDKEKDIPYGVVLLGLNNKYSFTEEQYADLATSFEQKKNFLKGSVDVIGENGEVEKSVLGIVAFADIYRKFELDVETGSSCSEDVCHLNTNFLDNENVRYCDGLGVREASLLIPDVSLRKSPKKLRIPDLQVGDVRLSYVDK